MVNGGVAAAISSAEAIFIQNPTFTDLFTQNIAVGEDGAFEVKSISEAKVISSFDVAAGKTFSFNFAADLDLTSKEIENPNTEYSKASSKTTFVVLDISNGVQNPKLLDFFGLTGNLISSQFTSIFNAAASNNVYFNSNKDIDINGNNGIDYIDGFATGNYQRYFGTNTKLAIIEMNSSLVKLRGDTLINNLGKDVKYGTIWDDDLKGTQYNDKIYASLGDDTIKGYDGNDIIEGAGGNDWLYGGDGRDSIYGGTGDDYIDGGYGLDYIDGGDGYDTVFYGDRFDNFSLDLATGVLEFSYTGNKEKVQNIEKVIASRGNDNIYGSQDSNHLEGNDGNDYIKGVGGKNVLIGGDGSDTLIGGNGIDKVIGTDSYNAGFYEQDYLQGGSGGDVFVLGDVNRAYYIKDGNHGYAKIGDFTVGEDKLKLHGSASDYHVNVYNGNAYIYYQDVGYNDKVAVVNNVYSNFDLKSNAIFTAPSFLHLENDGYTYAASYKDELRSDGTFNSERLSPSSGISNGTIGLATADGETFYHLYDDGYGSAALYKGLLQSDGTFHNTKLSSDSLISRNGTLGLATADGETFYYLYDDGYGSAALYKGLLQSDNTFHNIKLSSDSGISLDTVSFSTADGETFHHLYNDGYGTAASYESVLQSDGTFHNTLLNSASNITRGVLDQAAWFDSSSSIDHLY